MKFKFFWVLLVIILLLIFFTTPIGFLEFIIPLFTIIILTIIAIGLAITSIVKFFKFEFFTSFLIAVCCLSLAMGIFKLIPIWL